MAAKARRPVLRWSKVEALPRGQAVHLPFRFLSVAGLLFVLTGLGLLAYGFTGFGSGGTAPAFAAGEFVVYAQFGPTADIVYAAAPGEPSRRTKLFEIPHAREFGIVGATAPDGRLFAYAALPPDIAAPAPDSPAGLWLAPADGSAPPRLLGLGFDLRIRPVWSPDAGSIIARRSGAAAPSTPLAGLGGGVSAAPDGPFELVSLDIATGQTRSLVSSDVALFPVGFSPDGSTLFYTSVARTGSNLHRLQVSTGTSAPAGHLSDDLTRDWALSPSARHLAFLTFVPDGPRVSSRVLVLDIATGSLAASGTPEDEFGPAWSPAGELTYGRLTANRNSTGVVVNQRAISVPGRGFDVPLAWARSGYAIAVRSFDGASAAAPGTATLTVVATGGGRRTVAKGEVTFIGWTYR